MAGCNFTIGFNGPAAELVQKINTKVSGQGGVFAGDDSAGSFSVTLMGSTISGSYSIAGQRMNVIIDRKPFLISCNQIQNYLQGNLQ